MVDTANNIWRNYVVDGVSASGAHQPDKADIRAWGAWVETGLNAGTLNGPWMASLSTLNADLAHAANSVGFVYTTADIGTYVKSGASGSGSWTKILDYVPGMQISQASNNGSTANAWIMTTTPQASTDDGVTLIQGFVPITNSSATVTATFDGSDTLSVKTASNNNPPIGSLISGMPFLAVVTGSGTTLRLLSDITSSAIQIAAETAQVAAELAEANAKVYAENSGAGYPLIFENEITGTPSDGAIRFNNANLSAATEAYISVTNALGSGIEDRLLELYSAVRTVKDSIIISDDDSGIQATFLVTNAVSVGSPATHVTLTLSVHNGSTSFVDSNKVHLQRERVGNDGLFAVKGFIYADDYGAVGDGVTDDTAAIQSAIDSGASRIYFLDGTYSIGAAGLVCASDQEWVGESRSGVVLKLSTNPTANFINISGKTNVDIHGLTIDWNNKTPASNNASVNAFNSTNFRLHECNIINIAKFGVSCNSVTDFYIANNYIEKNTAADTQNQAINISSFSGQTSNGVVSDNVCLRSAMDVEGKYIKISGNKISAWKFGAGITTEQSASCSDLIISGNHINGSVGTDVNGYTCGGIENWATRSIIYENRIFNCAGAGIDQGGEHCILSGNIIFNNGRSVDSPGIAGRYGSATYNSSYSIYSANMCWDTDGASGHQTYGYEEQSASIYGVTLTDNKFEGNKTGVMSLLSGALLTDNGSFEFSASYAGATLTNGSNTQVVDLTAQGATLGNIVTAGYSADLQGLTLTAFVNATNNVRVYLYNGTGVSKTVAAGTFYISVKRHRAAASL